MITTHTLNELHERLLMRNASDRLAYVRLDGMRRCIFYPDACMTPDEMEEAAKEVRKLPVVPVRV